MERVFAYSMSFGCYFFIHHYTLLHSTIGHTFNNVFLGKEEEHTKWKMSGSSSGGFQPVT